MDQTTPAVQVAPVAPTATVLNKRPLFLTMICNFYFIFWTVNMIALISALVVRMGSQFPAWADIFNQMSMIFTGAQVSVSWITWLVTIGLVAGIIGYWFLQKWAVIVFMASTVALFIVVWPSMASAQAPSMIITIINYVFVTISIFSLNIAMIVLGLIYFKRMK